MEDWTTRYRVVSAKGRYYTRAMMYCRCARVCGPGNGPAIRALLDDDTFMRFLTGMVPSAVADAVHSRLIADGVWVWK